MFFACHPQIEVASLAARAIGRHAVDALKSVVDFSERVPVRMRNRMTMNLEGRSGFHLLLHQPDFGHLQPPPRIAQARFRDTTSNAIRRRAVASRGMSNSNGWNGTGRASRG